jgi:hypothetical protein
MRTEGDAPKLQNGSLSIHEIPGPNVSGYAAHMQKGIQTGDLLQAKTGLWTPASPSPALEVQWFRCTSGATCTPIAGRTQEQYLIGPEDLGLQLAFTVTATTKSGRAMYRSSLSEKVERPAGIPPKLQSGSTLSIRREAGPGRGGSNRPIEVGDKLVATPGTWDMPLHGEATFQWERCASPNPAACRPILGAKDPHYVLTLADVGAQVRVVQTATSMANLKGTAESQLTDKVAAESAPKKP